MTFITGEIKKSKTINLEVLCSDTKALKSFPVLSSSSGLYSLQRNRQANLSNTYLADFEFQVYFVHHIQNQSVDVKHWHLQNINSLLSTFKTATNLILLM